MGKANISYVTIFSFGLFLFTILMMENSFALDSLSRSQELSVGKTLISSGKTFELGFFTPGNSSKRYIGIWYKNIDWSRPIWVANRENPLDVSDAAPVLTIARDGNLNLIDGNKNILWSTNVTSKANNTIAVISDKGELSLKDNVTGTVLWESFDKVSDSFIAGMKIGHNNRTGEKYELNSWRAEDDPSPGQFVLGYTKDSPPQNIMWKNGETHWRSGPWDGGKFIGLSQSRTGYLNGLMVTQDNREGSVFASYC